ncbi:DNA cytosine methyltransferase [uncultured Prevotella sp.]|uniref:DNA cytosine methyltransferase n=1 Tax=uncultured Prevotella sp. TaxID=159272 RepID=UPI0025E73582|nr:DNA cytosine methyltransferase [uncultured Prevotella sp.]
MKYNTIDLFAGCGGLMDGFMQEGGFNTLACVEWEPFPCQTLANRLEKRWHHKNAKEEVVRFDIQRTNELINGFDDEKYGKHIGLKKLIGDKKIDIVIGGPPCQAYSLAGRIRDPHGMRDDYRNYLFESYIRILEYFKPAFFVFENVVGMLSAAPDGTPIVDKIRKAFDDAGYCVIDDFKNAVYDVADFGIPQHRKRVIILGVNKTLNTKDSDLCKKILDDFYKEQMPKFINNATPKTVKDAIGDLPAIFPSKEVIRENGHKFSHQPINGSGVMNHVPRFHSERDQRIFSMLAEDIESGKKQYISIEALKELYTEMTGKKSNIHKYYVLRWNEPSNTIPAHLYKDGMRHIHPDSVQARSITVREAARLQTFADDFEFLGPMMAQYKMIGNAVPSDFAKIIAQGLHTLLNKYYYG